MNAKELDRARKLGFKVSDRLEHYVSDYTLKLNEDTLQETERWSTKKVYFWNVIFPSDYPNQKSHAIYDDTELLALIKQYHMRFEDTKHAAEYSQMTTDALSKFKDMIKPPLLEPHPLIALDRC